MGSPAQDRRHQDILDNAKQRVFETKSKITQKKQELKELEKQLLEAEKQLEIQEYIDMKRD